MNLDAKRQRRKIIREQQLARSQALTTATAQGAASSSSLQGAFASTQGQTNTAIRGVDANQQLGGEVFAANRQYAAGQTQSNTGQAIASIGGQIMGNQEQLTRVGSYLFGV